MTADEREVLAEVLAAHHWGDDTAGAGEYAVQCGCGWKAYSSGIYDLRAKHDTHRANALADWLRHHDACVRAEERERIAQAIEDSIGTEPVLMHVVDWVEGVEYAASIARADREAGR